MTDFLLLISATYLVTYYATNEELDGLFNCLVYFRRLMRWLGSQTAQIIGCHYCFTFWASLSLVSMYAHYQHFNPIIWGLYVLAVAGVVTLLFQLTDFIASVATGADWYSNKVDGELNNYDTEGNE